MTTTHFTRAAFCWAPRRKGVSGEEPRTERRDARRVSLAVSHRPTRSAHPPFPPCPRPQLPRVKPRADAGRAEEGRRREKAPEADNKQHGGPGRWPRYPGEGDCAGEGCRGEGQGGGLPAGLQAVHGRAGPLHDIPQVREEPDDAPDDKGKVLRVPRARRGAEEAHRF